MLYPRAGTLGGCTAHNAMIFVYPHNADWNQIADLTGDPSWRAETMRAYFERIERCEHRADERARSRLGRNPSRHGWSRLAADRERACPTRRSAIEDLRTAILESARTALSDPELAMTDADRRARLESQLDPNDWRVVVRRRDRPSLHAADDAGTISAWARANACSTSSSGIPTA